MFSTNKRFRSLATRISFSIIVLGTVIFISVLGTNYMLSRNLLLDYVAELARTSAVSTVKEIETVFSSVATSADSLAAIVIKTDISKQQIQDAIRAMLRINPNIYGMTVALEPNVLNQAIGEFAPYYYRRDDGLSYTDLVTEEYRYRLWDWYSIPMSSNGTVWTEPYFDEGGGNALMTTYSTPLLAGSEHRFAGVATADIALDWLQQLVEDIHVLETGYSLIVSKNDTIVAHPDASLVMQQLKPTLEPDFIDTYWDIYRQSKHAHDATYFNAPCRYQSGSCWIAVKPLLDTGWKAVIVIPESELISDIIALTGQIAALAMAGLFILVAVIISVTRKMIHPLNRLASVTADIGSGNLGIKLPAPERNDEIGALTIDFRNMRNALRGHIEQLRQTTAKQQKLESEIEIARSIQMSMVPGGGSTSIQGLNFQLYALLKPARSVGGDLYYFKQQARKLHFIVGDVSDKGVAAALFMAKAVTLYTGALKDQLSPGDTLQHMNQALTQNNDACMFVTALCGTLDLDNGELIMANAGHMQPLHKTAAASGEMIVEGSMALGLMEDIAYPNVIQRLSPDSSLLMYTDGISEAFNTDREQYGEERLYGLMANVTDLSADAMGSATLADLAHFVGNAQQSDDITLMVIYYGN